MVGLLICHHVICWTCNGVIRFGFSTWISHVGQARKERRMISRVSGYGTMHSGIRLWGWVFCLLYFCYFLIFLVIMFVSYYLVIMFITRGLLWVYYYHLLVIMLSHARTSDTVLIQFSQCPSYPPRSVINPQLPSTTHTTPTCVTGPMVHPLVPS